VPSQRHPVRFVRNNWKSILVLTIGIPVIAVVGVVRWNDVRGPEARSTTPNSLAVSDRTTTSFDITLNDRQYKAGDCVTWNLDLGKRSERSTKIVPCDQPHLFEHVAKVSIHHVTTFPTSSEWLSIIDTACAKPVADRLGYALDPQGKFFHSAIHPRLEGWNEGDRELNCGIGARRDAGGDEHYDIDVLFAGVVKGQDQTFLLPVGTCYSYPTADTGRSVPCTEPHDVEVTGHTDINTAALPSTAGQWSAATEQCESLSASYAPSAAASGFEYGYLTMEQSSWDTGRRKVECTLAKYDRTGSTVEVTGSVKG
jgi:hypothetical protein